MFLRGNLRNKDGKDHTYWSLVETVRTPDGPRQKTLCYPGELRACEPGDQQIRLIFDEPVSVGRIQGRFDEPATERTQEFTLRWSAAWEASTDIIRQQWNFSPGGPTTELEDHIVNLAGNMPLPQRGRMDPPRRHRMREEAPGLGPELQEAPQAFAQAIVDVDHL
jgi:hypothetical protein